MATAEAHDLTPEACNKLVSNVLFPLNDTSRSMAVKVVLKVQLPVMGT